ncbi:hypothetical protein G7070_11825 [Propioniciclava coleopterorum]|uniref:Peptidoglycan binding domain-containing protein n=1 Tax=Propioniciclava coleopterorum TaxID=2714937 RepID=A0A6G7Y830_9ACTN|nr:hypothetical protein [Propioniciclava coleopterorum]QIK72836.1 hypothetical protein G7070_11825 [Propioniciclava coleopterorum]
MTDHPTSPAPRKRRAGRIAAVAGGALVVLLGAGYGVAYAISGNTLAPQTTVSGVEVGGLDPAAAQAKLTSELGPRASAPLTVAAGEKSVQLTPSNWGWASTTRPRSGPRAARSPSTRAPSGTT